MFQYAVGRSISLKKDTALHLDTSYFEDYVQHQGFELHSVFNLTAEISSKDELRSVLGWQSHHILRRILSVPIMAIFRNNKFIVEPYFKYWEGVNNLSENCYISGYWQSERYFVDVNAKIREDFLFKGPMSHNNNELAESIGQVNAISLHVRRGDYATNALTTSVHGLCSLAYYRMAIEYISKRVDDPYFFIFSDDIGWVKSNLNISFPHQFVDHNHGKESFNDMRLMSMCQHHIIANSSFSWWGAWLNPNLDKIVVAPRKWFANKTDSDDLIPNSWVKL